MTRVVYSTGGSCSSCGHPIAGCRCSQPEEKKNSAGGPVRVLRETKGRKGKGVTAVHGLVLPVDELKALARELKQACGSGGTVKDGVIEIQGDHRERVVEELAARGIVAKRAGG